VLYDATLQGLGLPYEVGVIASCIGSQITLQAPALVTSNGSSDNLTVPSTWTLSNPITQAQPFVSLLLPGPNNTTYADQHLTTTTTATGNNYGPITGSIAGSTATISAGGAVANLFLGQSLLWNYNAATSSGAIPTTTTTGATLTLGQLVIPIVNCGGVLPNDTVIGIDGGSHQLFAPGTTVGSCVGTIATYGTLSGGTGYTPASGTATYNGVALTGGSGSGATANITVTNGSVTNVVQVSGGIGYKWNDSLSAAAGTIGGTVTTAFSIPVATTTNSILTINPVPMVGAPTATLVSGNPIIYQSNTYYLAQYRLWSGIPIVGNGIGVGTTAATASGPWLSNATTISLSGGTCPGAYVIGAALFDTTYANSPLLGYISSCSAGVVTLTSQVLAASSGSSDGLAVGGHSTVSSWKWSPGVPEYMDLTLADNSTLSGNETFIIGGAIYPGVTGANLYFFNSSGKITSCPGGVCGGAGAYGLTSGGTLPGGSSLYFYETPSLVKITAGVHPLYVGDFIWADGWPFGALVFETYGTTAGYQGATIGTTDERIFWNGTVTHTAGSGSLWTIPSGMKFMQGVVLRGNAMTQFGVGLNLVCSQSTYPGTGCGKSLMADNLYQNNVIGSIISGNNGGGFLNSGGQWNKNWMVDIVDLLGYPGTHISPMLQSCDQSTNTSTIIATAFNSFAGYFSGCEYTVTGIGPYKKLIGGTPQISGTPFMYMPVYQYPRDSTVR
jgi:hypothetical protein